MQQQAEGKIIWRAKNDFDKVCCENQKEKPTLLEITVSGCVWYCSNQPK